MDESEEAGGPVRVAFPPSKRLKRRSLPSALRYGLVCVFGVIVASLVFYALREIGY